MQSFPYRAANTIVPKDQLFTILEKALIEGATRGSLRPPLRAMFVPIFISKTNEAAARQKQRTKKKKTPPKPSCKQEILRSLFLMKARKISRGKVRGATHKVANKTSFYDFGFRCDKLWPGATMFAI